MSSGLSPIRDFPVNVELERWRSLPGRVCLMKDLLWEMEEPVFFMLDPYWRLGVIFVLIHFGHFFL